MMVEIALISGCQRPPGLVPYEHGNVVCPGPATSWVIVKSSNETMNASAVPDRMPGTARAK